MKKTAITWLHTDYQAAYYTDQKLLFEKLEAFATCKDDEPGTVADEEVRKCY